MNNHDLKINPVHYNNVIQGTKTFEIRKNDRAFQKGDKVALWWWPIDADRSQNVDHYSETFKKPPLFFKVGDVYPIDNEYVVFSLIKIKTKEENENTDSTTTANI